MGDIMKGIYVIFDSINNLKKNYQGVYKKIEAQVNVFNEENLNTKLYFIEYNRGKLNKIARRLPFDLFINNIQLPKNIDVDFFYIRKGLLNYPFIKFLREIKLQNPNCKILLEIPTFPYDNEINKSIKNLPLYIKDKFYRNILYKYVDRIVTFSKDEKIFGIPTINISNGVEISKIRVRKPVNSKGINIIAVASFDYWHGYDRFIKGLGEYYQHGGKESIYFHVVGDGRVLPYYKKLVEKYNLGDRVIFYGFKTGKELDLIYDKCEIALDAMGRHRSGVYFNSSIKGKEYAAKGLPIISGVRTELDDNPDFKYYFRVPANETPIDIREVIKFYKNVYSDKSHNAVIWEIRKYAEKQFDIHECMKPVVQYIKFS